MICRLPLEYLSVRISLKYTALIIIMRKKSTANPWSGYIRSSLMKPRDRARSSRDIPVELACSGISPSDWPGLLWAGGRVAWSRHVFQRSLGSKRSPMGWDLRAPTRPRHHHNQWSVSRAGLCAFRAKTHSAHCQAAAPALPGWRSCPGQSSGSCWLQWNLAWRSESGCLHSAGCRWRQARWGTGRPPTPAWYWTKWGHQQQNPSGGGLEKKV